MKRAALAAIAIAVHVSACGDDRSRVSRDAAAAVDAAPADAALADAAQSDASADASPPQPNDSCETALTVTESGTYYGDTSTFTSHSAGSCGGDGGEAVFRIVLAARSRLRITSAGTPSPPFDSVVILRAESCAGGQEWACDDDSGGGHAGLIDLAVVNAGTYFAFVDGFSQADRGTYQLTITIDPLP